MARNYVLAWAIKFHVGDPAFPGLDTDLAAWGTSRDDLMNQANIVLNDFITANPGFNWVATYPTDPIKQYILLDKQTVVRGILGNANQALFNYISNVGVPQNQQIIQMLNETPRYKGWTDQAGEKHAAPPADKKGFKQDFAGASGLFSAFQNLPLLAEKLRKEGRVRDAGIVLYAYNQVVAGLWTITHAIAYISENANV